MNEMLAAVTPFIIGDSATLADSIRSFIGPILMVAVGIIAITFLVRREMTQFILFLVIAIAVFALFYAPDIIKTLAQGVATGAGGSWEG